MKDAFFKKAFPIWPRDCEREKNITCGFLAQFHSSNQKISVAITASNLYRLFCNGKFVGYGPARAAHGYARVDYWPIDDSHLNSDLLNHIAIEVVSYNTPSFYVLNETPFLQAEILEGANVLAATDEDFSSAFLGFRLAGRVQRVQRYSYQRPFSEAYRLKSSCNDWRTNASLLDPLPLRRQAQRHLHHRGVHLPAFAIVPAKVFEGGLAERRLLKADYWRDRSLLLAATCLGSFAEAELETILSLEAQEWENTSRTTVEAKSNLELREGNYALFDLSRNLSGFIRFKVNCFSFCKILVSFDEILLQNDVKFNRLDCVNLLSYELEAGEYDLESFEAYTCRYIKILVTEGNCSLKEVSLRTYENSETGKVHFEISDQELNSLVRAAEATYAQNTVDLLMDCPSRERAGWLNDSFFSARSAFLFSGNANVETNFLENFVEAPGFSEIPRGMMPMCYPSDIIENGYTPNLPCWLICEMGEMRQRGVKEAIIQSYHPQVNDYFQYLSSFANEYGLLEGVPGWIFIEWSKANEWTQDVNIPFNLLFSDALLTASQLYGNEAWLKQAISIREAVLQLAYDGQFFHDNLIRNNGALILSGNHSEICQYHAFWSGIATPKSHPDLLNLLVVNCGPLSTQQIENLEPANMIMGRYMRFDLLAKFELQAQLLLELKATFGRMAEQTGTLWEHIDTRSSCNHGLAAHAAVSLIRDIAGLELVDILGKKIVVTLHDLPLMSADIVHPVGAGCIKLKWEKIPNGKIICEVNAPSDFALTINNKTGRELVQLRS